MSNEKIYEGVAITQEMIDAAIEAYGFSKREAKDYLKRASVGTREALVKGFKQQAERSFFEDAAEDKTEAFILTKRNYDPVTREQALKYGETAGLEQVFVVDKKEFMGLVKQAKKALIENPNKWAFNRMHQARKTRPFGLAKDAAIKDDAEEWFNYGDSGRFEEQLKYNIATATESFVNSIYDLGDKSGWATATDDEWAEAIYKDITHWFARNGGQSRNHVLRFGGRKKIMELIHEFLDTYQDRKKAMAGAEDKSEEEENRRYQAEERDEELRRRDRGIQDASENLMVKKGLRGLWSEEGANDFIWLLSNEAAVEFLKRFSADPINDYPTDVDIEEEGSWFLIEAGDRAYAELEGLVKKHQDAAADEEEDFGGKFEAMGEVTVADARSPKALVEAITNEVETNNEFYASTKVYAAEFLKEAAGAEFSKFLKNPNEQEFNFDKTIKVVWKGFPDDDEGDDDDYLWVTFVKDNKAKDARGWYAAPRSTDYDNDEDYTDAYNRWIGDVVEPAIDEWVDQIAAKFPDAKKRYLSNDAYVEGSELLAFNTFVGEYNMRTHKEIKPFTGGRIETESEGEEKCPDCAGKLDSDGRCYNYSCESYDPISQYSDKGEDAGMNGKEELFSVYILRRRGDRFTFAVVDGMWEDIIASFSFKKNESMKNFVEIIKKWVPFDKDADWLMNRAPGFVQRWGEEKKADDTCKAADAIQYYRGIRITNTGKALEGVRFEIEGTEYFADDYFDATVMIDELLEDRGADDAAGEKITSEEYAELERRATHSELLELYDLDYRVAEMIESSVAELGLVQDDEWAIAPEVLKNHESMTRLYNKVVDKVKKLAAAGQLEEKFDSDLDRHYGRHNTVDEIKRLLDLVNELSDGADDAKAQDARGWYAAPRIHDYEEIMDYDEAWNRWLDQVASPAAGSWIQKISEKFPDFDTSTLNNDWFVEHKEEIKFNEFPGSYNIRARKETEPFQPEVETKEEPKKPVKVKFKLGVPNSDQFGGSYFEVIEVWEEQFESFAAAMEAVDKEFQVYEIQEYPEDDTIIAWVY